MKRTLKDMPSFYLSKNLFNQLLLIPTTLPITPSSIIGFLTFTSFSMPLYVLFLSPLLFPSLFPPPFPSLLFPYFYLYLFPSLFLLLFLLSSPFLLSPSFSPISTSPFFLCLSPFPFALYSFISTL